MSRANAVFSHPVLLGGNVIYVVNLLVEFNFLIQFIYIEALELENTCQLFMYIFASLKMARKNIWLRKEQWSVTTLLQYYFKCTNSYCAIRKALWMAGMICHLEITAPAGNNDVVGYYLLKIHGLPDTPHFFEIPRLDFPLESRKAILQMPGNSNSVTSCDI